jgi:hypothetical protein
VQLYFPPLLHGAGRDNFTVSLDTPLSAGSLDISYSFEFKMRLFKSFSEMKITVLLKFEELFFPLRKSPKKKKILFPGRTKCSCYKSSKLYGE